MNKQSRFQWRILVLGFVFLLPLSQRALGQDISDWKVNFPKSRQKVDQLPPPDSLYIFLMAGQSNMAGRGFVEPADTLPNPRILTLDQDNTWIYAQEPLHFYEPNLTGLDCGMSFGRTLLESLPQGVSIALLPCAVGGSSIEQWLGNETHRGVALLDNFKEKVAIAQSKGQIKGILWHQGESNANPELLPSYGQKLDSLIALFRGIVQEEKLPMVLGELGSYSETKESRENWKAINSILKKEVKGDPYLGLVKTKDLQHKGDQIHFDSEGQRKIGQRFAKTYLKIQ